MGTDEKMENNNMNTDNKKRTIDMDDMEKFPEESGDERDAAVKNARAGILI